MRIHIGGDHAAYELQRALVAHLTEGGHEVVDHGPADYDAAGRLPRLRPACGGGGGR